MLNENHEIHSSSLILIFAASALSQNFSLTKTSSERTPKIMFDYLTYHQIQLTEGFFIRRDEKLRSKLRSIF